MIVNDQSDLFNLAPIAMWLEDFSGVKRQLQVWKDAGVNDIRSYLRADLSRVAACASQIRVIAVNPKTLELFGPEIRRIWLKVSARFSVARCLKAISTSFLPCLRERRSFQALP